MKHLEDPGQYFKADLINFTQYKYEKEFVKLEG